MSAAIERAGSERQQALGSYRLLERVGRGGMAEVFAAVDTRREGVHRLVAVKVIRPELARNEEHVQMFEDEARFAAQLRHPNLCAALDRGCAQGRRFIVMEYLCGSPLSALAPLLRPRRCAFPGAERVSLVAHLITQVANGLDGLHQARDFDDAPFDAVHRDVAPDNVVVTCTGEVKLCDFGIVRARRRRHRTQPGKVKGKIAYLPPEALAGLPLDRRTDVWALGVIAWELFAGGRLFKRRNPVRTAAEVIQGVRTPPHLLAPDVPEVVSEAVLGALRSDPEARFSSAAAFGRALRIALGAGARTNGEVATWWRSTQSGRCAHRCMLERARASDDAAYPSPLPSSAGTPSTAQPAESGGARRSAPTAGFTEPGSRRCLPLTAARAREKAG